MFSSITEIFQESNKYPWYPEYEEERISYIDEDKNIVVHDSCINISQENNSQYIPFEMDRYYQGVDLMDMNLEVHFVNSQMGANHSNVIGTFFSTQIIDENAEINVSTAEE